MSSPNFSVRWVYQQVKIKKNGGYKMEAGQKPCLCFRGRKFALCIGAGYPIRVLKRPVADFDKYRLVMTTPPFNGPMDEQKHQQPPGQQQYPVAKAVEQLQALVASHGITAGAARILDRAALQQNGIDEDEYEDEETTMIDDNEGIEAPAIPAKETTVSKSKAKTTRKAKATKKAGKAKGTSKKPAAKGPTPFRPGTAKEAAFIAYKGARKEYEGLAKGDKGEWIGKQAKKLGVTPGTLRSWIGGDFAKALKA